MYQAIAAAAVCQIVCHSFFHIACDFLGELGDMTNNYESTLETVPVGHEAYRENALQVYGRSPPEYEATGSRGGVQSLNAAPVDLADLKKKVIVNIVFVMSYGIAICGYWLLNTSTIFAILLCRQYHSIILTVG